MTYRATVTLDADAYSFLQDAGGKNRSAFINQLLKEEKRRLLAAAVLKANLEEAADQQYQQELSEWEETLLDGLV
ncbi:MAG: CopG family transcriptional regulator [Aquificales bacterium]|nr:CopG family transcriptional regulator [Aquificales bacterium]